MTEAGLVVPATLPSCADALEWLDADEGHIALLDMHVLDGSRERLRTGLSGAASRPTNWCG